MDKIYRGLVVALIILQVIWFCFPWQIAYDSRSLEATQWFGYGAWISFEMIALISSFFMIIYLLVYAGLFFYVPLARLALFLLSVIGGLITPIYGMSIQSGYEGLLGHYIVLGDGFILAVAYFSSIGEKFKRREINERA